MLSYDPMRNTRPQAYPAMLLTAGLNDSRVGYWEPAKFVQRLRAANTGPRHVLFKCEMDEGHAGALDRFRSLRSRALELAWMLERLREAGGGGCGGAR
jgi:oligopeptidase B